MSDYCVCCGEYVPEGRMVCPNCEKKANQKPIQFTIYGNPITKKNSQRIVMVRGRPIIMPSKAYKDYEKQCKFQIPALGISTPVSVRVKYYRATRHRVDLTNLLEATDDCLVAYGCLTDDDSRVIHDHDGSRVFFDKENPRAEITIYKLQEDM